MGTGIFASTARFYIHDHLYSPAALTDYSGNILERYEYDAYGNPYILDTQYAPRTTSNYGNPYLFTGRRVDILDSGSLKIQYNRNRYYDYYTGRWLTHDPLDYVDGLNLYEYARSSPGVNTDPYGFMSDSEFALKFIYHYFLGMGALWDKGADVLKRQESVKEAIGQQLRYMAKSFCTEALNSGGFASGSFFKMLRGERPEEQVFANSSVFLKWTLNGAEHYIISGKYEAKACALECPCTVRLKDVEHIWGDMGDLNLSRDIGSHWPDWLVWFATRIGIPPAVVAHSLGIFAIDFQVSISWTENNFLWKPTVRDSFRDERGWPFWPYDYESSR